jgi:hypothetical protein
MLRFRPEYENNFEGTMYRMSGYWFGRGDSCSFTKIRPGRRVRRHLTCALHDAVIVPPPLSESIKIVVISERGRFGRCKYDSTVVPVPVTNRVLFLMTKVWMLPAVLYKISHNTRLYVSLSETTVRMSCVIIFAQGGLSPPWVGVR